LTIWPSQGRPADSELAGLDAVERDPHDVGCVVHRAVLPAFVGVSVRPRCSPTTSVPWGARSRRSDMIVVPAARHALDALEDSAVLLTVSTPAAQPVPR
jgi:hypothetical protein